LEAQRTTQLTTSDVSLVLEFLLRLRSSMVPGVEITSSMKVGEIGTSIPSDINTARKLIEQYGGPDELDYLALYVPRICSVEADFRKSVLRIMARSESEAYELFQRWTELKQSHDTN
jgi:hypothetical protein